MDGLPAEGSREALLTLVSPPYICIVYIHIHTTQITDKPAPPLSPRPSLLSLRCPLHSLHHHHLHPPHLSPPPLRRNPQIHNPQPPPRTTATHPRSLDLYSSSSSNGPVTVNPANERRHILIHLDLHPKTAGHILRYRPIDRPPPFQSVVYRPVRRQFDRCPVLDLLHGPGESRWHGEEG